MATYALESDFPAGFAWSVATSAYQIEGAHDEDGKGPSMWDKFCKSTETTVKDGFSGDVACDSYHQYEKDIELLTMLNVTHYRFSLSWPRIMPDGCATNVNKSGVEFYHKFIDALKKEAIQPQVTLYHWDLPQSLSSKGGWLNPKIVDWFTDFANFCFKEFGEKVKFWTTINEPYIHALKSYGVDGTFAPCGLKKRMPRDFFVASRHMIIAHAKAWHLYNSHYRDKQFGQVGLTNCFTPGYPISAKECDMEAAERYNLLQFGLYFHPILSERNNYPQEILDSLEKISSESFFIPELTEEDRELLKGATDFIGLNYYTSRMVEKGKDSDSFYDSAIEVKPTVDDVNMTETSLDWLWVFPQGLRFALNWIKNAYGSDTPIYILENGIADKKGVLNDMHRIRFIEDHLRQVLKAIHKDSCRVQGYTVWSLLDNFEWEDGYVQRFGLTHVDFNSKERKRTLKWSGKFFSKIAVRNRLAEMKDFYNDANPYEYDTTDSVNDVDLVDDTVQNMS